jgi:catechol 1,2-dioxygenase
MREKLLHTAQVKALINKVAGFETSEGDQRLKKIIERVVTDVMRTIEDFDVSPTEFWAAAAYLTKVGQSHEMGLLIPGLGIEHFLDLRMDQQEREAGLTGGTPRTIEGPLYIEGAPLSKGEARLDQDPETGEVLFMDGQVKDAQGNPVPGAIVDVWHANTDGWYSHFDPKQTPFNLRRRIETDVDGKYKFRSMLPKGYGVPPDGPTNELLSAIGRHGERPAHIHFFVSAPGYRKLTTQINIDGDPLLHDDFAFATRDELIPAITHHTDTAEINARGLNEPFATITFDFTMHKEAADLPAAVVERAHAA